MRVNIVSITEYIGFFLLKVKFVFHVSVLLSLNTVLRMDHTTTIVLLNTLYYTLLKNKYSHIKVIRNKNSFI